MPLAPQLQVALQGQFSAADADDDDEAEAVVDSRQDVTRKQLDGGFDDFEDGFVFVF